MLFSSSVFLFLFLPGTIIGYFVLRGAWRNVFLLLASLVFFAWGGVSYSFLLIFSILANYMFGRLIGRSLSTKKAKQWLIAGVTVNLVLIGIFKYANFLIFNLNEVLGTFSIPTVSNPSIILPIGISFYTFQSISYLVDVYRRETDVQKNILRLGLYISLFPQLIAGPIVRYHDIALQLHSRTTSFSTFSYGVQRFLTGLGKKVIIANSCAYVADEIFAMAPADLSAPMAWLGIISYTFQIYFDFSGYSDMAIGLGSMFGFRIPENFNFPYIAQSIKEFWRRWHISLSTWFRDYLYIPLGGNRFGTYRTLLNLFIVFFLTGLWHGASWNFVVWGMLHGVFLVAERLGGDKIIDRVWKPVRHFYTLFIVVMAWVLFRSSDITYAWGYYKAMFGYSGSGSGVYEFYKYLNNEFLLVLALGILASTPLFINLGRRISRSVQQLPSVSRNVIGPAGAVLTTSFYLGLLVLCAMYLLSDSYNPFIYYRF